MFKTSFEFWSFDIRICFGQFIKSGDIRASIFKAVIGGSLWFLLESV
jgi:hypothetical protein